MVRQEYPRAAGVCVGGACTIRLVIGPRNRPAEASRGDAQAAHAAPLTGQAQIDRGKMLVIGGGCHDCHTPKKLGPNGPEFDYDRALSGQPAGREDRRAVQERSQESLAGPRER